MAIDPVVTAIAQHLEAEVPYETCSKWWTHEGWVDLVETIRDTCPRAYEDLVAHYTTERALTCQSTVRMKGSQS